MKLSNINFNDVYFTLTVMILKIGLGLGLRYICSGVKTDLNRKILKKIGNKDIESLFYGNFNLFGHLIVACVALVGYRGSVLTLLLEFGHFECCLTILFDLGGEGLLIDFDGNLGVCHCLSLVVL